MVRGPGPLPGGHALHVQALRYVESALPVVIKRRGVVEGLRVVAGPFERNDGIHRERAKELEPSPLDRICILRT